MKPEELKIIAEWLGHEGFLVKDGRKCSAYHIYIEREQDMPRGREFRKSIGFNPEANAEQLCETLEKILMANWSLDKWQLSKIDGGKVRDITADTLPQAILAAALKEAE